MNTIVERKIRGFISLTSHAVGCAKAVDEQIAYVKSQGKFNGPKNVLVIGASTGYGLASLITTVFGANAKAIGVFFERPADDKRTASAGWYNAAHVEQAALASGHYVKSINGDAFSDDIKLQAIDLIRRDLKQVDLVIYSVASPRRIHPVTGEIFSSVLKPIGQDYCNKTVDAFRGEVKDVTLPSATDSEIANTVAVMGGDDWERWIDFLTEARVLAPHVVTVNYSYIGPDLTHPIYKDGTIGQAKAHIKRVASKLNHKLQHLQGEAVISVNKAVVTQASAAIPVVPLYISLLFKVMKEKGTHEGCIEQMLRLFKNRLYGAEKDQRDAEGYIRLDDFEMDPAVQAKIAALWPQINNANLAELTDIEGYRRDFYRLFGFDMADVDYTQPIETAVGIPSLLESVQV